MATTRLSDLFVPQIFGPTAFQESVRVNKLVSSGAIALSPGLSANLAGGGIAFNAPYFGSIVDTASPAFVPNDDPTDIAVAKKIGTLNQVSIRLMRNNAYAVMDVASILSGTDPMARITSEIGAAINDVRQSALLNILAGTVNETRAANLVNTIGVEVVGSQTAATKLSGGAFIESLSGWGDAASDMSNLTIMMHSDTYRKLAADNLIVYSAPAGQVMGFSTYLGARVIVDDSLPKRAGTTSGFVYTTYVMRNGAIQLGTASVDTPVELERSALIGNTGGGETITWRDMFAYHVNGFSWAGGVAAVPTDVALATATNWTKVYNDKQVGVVAIVHN